MILYFLVILGFWILNYNYFEVKKEIKELRHDLNDLTIGFLEFKTRTLIKLKTIERGCFGVNDIPNEESEVNND